MKLPVLIFLTILILWQTETKMIMQDLRVWQFAFPVRDSPFSGSRGTMRRDCKGLISTYDIACLGIIKTDCCFLSSELWVFFWPSGYTIWALPILSRGQPSMFNYHNSRNSSFLVIKNPWLFPLTNSGLFYNGLAVVAFKLILWHVHFSI